MSLCRRTWSAVAIAVASACGGAQETLGPVTSLPLAAPPAFAAKVSKVTYESGIGPGSGLYQQYDVWIAVTPSSTTNAGVVVPKAGPVFVQTSDGLVHAAGADMIRVGDSIQIWRTQTIVYGATQGPPGAPTYEATQVVIER